MARKNRQRSGSGSGAAAGKKGGGTQRLTFKVRQAGKAKKAKSRAEQGRGGVGANTRVRTSGPATFKPRKRG